MDIIKIRFSRLSGLPLPISALCLMLVILVGAPAAQDEIPPCESDPAFSWLDFWLGDWDVYVGEKQVGTNHIEKILKGCAVIEEWRSATGSEGQSLFYYIPAIESWKQVWVTEYALVTGGVKEKQMIERFDDGSVRFQGSIQKSDSTAYLDRTTLTPISADSVRQVIEVSKDDGANWSATFDAIYVRSE